jgi:hypothetical protein
MCARNYSLCGTLHVDATTVGEWSAIRKLHFFCSPVAVREQWSRLANEVLAITGWTDPRPIN